MRSSNILKFQRQTKLMIGVNLKKKTIRSVLAIFSLVTVLSSSLPPTGLRRRHNHHQQQHNNNNNNTVKPA